jgi:hypothetical protein
MYDTPESPSSVGNFLVSPFANLSLVRTLLPAKGASERVWQGVQFASKEPFRCEKRSKSELRKIITEMTRSEKW